MIDTFDKLVARSQELKDGYLRHLEESDDPDANRKQLAVCEYLNDAMLAVVPSATDAAALETAHTLMEWVVEGVIAGRLDVYSINTKSTTARAA